MFIPNKNRIKPSHLSKWEKEIEKLLRKTPSDFLCKWIVIDSLSKKRKRKYLNSISHCDVLFLCNVHKDQIRMVHILINSQ